MSNFRYILIVLLLTGCYKNSDPVIILSSNADNLEKLAASEIRKYIYLRTDKLLSIKEWNGKSPIKGQALIIGCLAEKKIGEKINPDLCSDEFVIKTLSQPDGNKIFLFGGSKICTLYAAYYLAEEIGVGFYLDGDIIPDKKIPFSLPVLDIRMKSLFSVRGIIPFHDFPEGPDWWSIEDYKSVIGQLPKLRMNFIGFNTYPEGDVGPEPMVWIGPPWAIDRNNKVKLSYPSSHFMTFDSDPYKWGYEPMKTGEYFFGLSQIFEQDNFGADYMMELGPYPLSYNDQNILFEKFGMLLSDAFSFARKLNIKTCIGTETPLIIPQKLLTHLNALDKNPKDPKVIQEIYEGIFQRIKSLHPLDYYWLWTAEKWLQGIDQKVIDETVIDINSAIAAENIVQPSFTLATCGWVLGPQNDRSFFDKFLPKNMPISSLNRGAGFMPIDPDYFGIIDRPKWAIPWLEDDAAMIIPQLWVGRMRRDAADALQYGCTGLIGIHWRTRILGPNISALADAAWTQEGWNPDHHNFFDPSKDSKPSLQDYEKGIKTRDLPSYDFYVKWARISFGDGVSDNIAKIFTNLDGGEFNSTIKYKSNLPRPSTWVDGPGGIVPDHRPWAEVKKEYFFINELENLRQYITGPGNIDRFDYWLNQFKYMRGIGHLNCKWSEFNEIILEISREKNAEVQKCLAKDKALPLRIEMIQILTELQNHLISTMSSYGEMGTITNWQQHILPQLIRDPGVLLEKYLEDELPETASLPTYYTGVPKIIVSKMRSILQNDECLNLKIRLISPNGVSPLNLEIFWRELGKQRFKSQKLQHINRGVYHAYLSPNEISDEGLEYFIQVDFTNGDQIRFPSAAPIINQTVILLPE